MAERDARAARPVAPKSGQSGLYEEAVETFGAAIERLARSYELDEHKRQDLLQNIHLNLWRSLERFDGQCSLRTWVYRVAHNVATTHVMDERRRRSRPLDRELVVLYLEGLSAAEIGEVVGISAGNVSTRINRIKTLLSHHAHERGRNVV